MKKFSMLGIVLLFFTTEVWAQADIPVIRSKIAVYPYSAPKEGFTFDHFLVFLDTNTGNLMAEIDELLQNDSQRDKSPVHNDKLLAITSVEIQPIDVEKRKTILQTNDFNKIWIKNKRLLEILSGTITENPQRTGYTINSQIYSEVFSKIGSRKRISLMDDSSQHTTANFLNGHHVALLYSMAMFAKKRHEPLWLTMRLLSKAHELGGNIDFSHSATAKSLKRQILQELTEQERLVQSVDSTK